jgi:hypothetical protein
LLPHKSRGYRSRFTENFRWLTESRLSSSIDVPTVIGEVDLDRELFTDNRA